MEIVGSMRRLWMCECVYTPTTHTIQPGCKNRLGRAQRVSIRSLGWDGQLTIDGITMIPFNFGVQVRAFVWTHRLRQTDEHAH